MTLHLETWDPSIEDNELESKQSCPHFGIKKEMTNSSNGDSQIGEDPLTFEDKVNIHEAAAKWAPHLIKLRAAKDVDGFASVHQMLFESAFPIQSLVRDGKVGKSKTVFLFNRVIDYLETSRLQHVLTHSLELLQEFYNSSEKRFDVTSSYHFLYEALEPCGTAIEGGFDSDALESRSTSTSSAGSCFWDEKKAVRLPAVKQRELSKALPELMSLTDSGNWEAFSKLAKELYGILFEGHIRKTGFVSYSDIRFVLEHIPLLIKDHPQLKNSVRIRSIIRTYLPSKLFYGWYDFCSLLMKVCAKPQQVAVSTVVTSNKPSNKNQLIAEAAEKFAHLPQGMDSDVFNSLTTELFDLLFDGHKRDGGSVYYNTVKVMLGRLVCSWIDLEYKPMVSLGLRVIKKIEQSDVMWYSLEAFQQLLRLIYDGCQENSEKIYEGFSVCHNKKNGVSDWYVSDVESTHSKSDGNTSTDEDKEESKSLLCSETSCEQESEVSQKSFPELPSTVERQRNHCLACRSYIGQEENVDVPRKISPEVSVTSIDSSSDSESDDEPVLEPPISQCARLKNLFRQCSLM